MTAMSFLLGSIPNSVSGCHPQCVGGPDSDKPSLSLAASLSFCPVAYGTRSISRSLMSVRLCQAKGTAQGHIFEQIHSAAG
eukprot:1979258-Pleurochrysis_carterae.AAC.1